MKYTITPLIVLPFGNLNTPLWVNPHIAKKTRFTKNDDGSRETVGVIRAYVAVGDASFITVFKSSLYKVWQSQWRSKKKIDFPEFYAEMKTVDWPIIGHDYRVVMMSPDCFLVDNGDGTWSVES